MPLLILILLVPAFLGTLAPLLTFAWLWQVKEWRMDRMAEHLSAEGYVRSLFGAARPAIFLACLLIDALGGLLAWKSANPSIALEAMILTTYLGHLAYALLSVIQLLRRGRRVPRWTRKAVMIVGVALLLTIGLIGLWILLLSTPLHGDWTELLRITFLLSTSLLLLPLLSPLIVAAARAVVWPLDRALKNRILAQAQELRLRYPDLVVIGITGSVGKTTTKELIGHLLEPLHPLVTPAYVNSELGVAQWMLRELRAYMAGRADGKGVLVVEMGAYRKGEIALMSGYVRQTMAVVTYVGTQHLALFGSPQALFEAKSEIIAHLPADGRAFANADCEACLPLKDIAPCPITFVGTGRTGELRATDVEEAPGGFRFRVRETHITVPMHGTHNVVNVLLALAVGEALGLTLSDMQKRLLSFQPPSRTFAVRTERGVRILDDTHNASAASFKAAIAWARTQPEEPKILLTSGLQELGELQEQTERELGGLAADVFDRAVFLHKRQMGAFAAGAGAPLEILGKGTERVPAGSLLVCISKMPDAAIHRLLPPDA
jgi:UDP-N-acetylmuramoyl-tripeptide--D-alanyl-D-alanine ligase